MSVRSFGNPVASFRSRFGRTGVGAALSPSGATIVTVDPASGQLPYGLDQSDAGYTDFLNRNYTASPDPAGRRKWTFATWFKKQTSTTLWLLGALNTGNNNHFNFRINSNGSFEAYQYEFTVEYGAFSTATGATSAMDGNWHHAVVNYDSTQATNSNRIRFYLDGTELTITTSSWPTLNQYLTAFDGSGNNYVGRNGYTDAYTNDMQWGDTYIAHNQRYDASNFISNGLPVDSSTVLSGQSTSTWGSGAAFLYANNTNFGVNSLSGGTNWTSNGYSSGDQLTNIQVVRALVFSNSGDFQNLFGVGDNIRGTISGATATISSLNTGTSTAFLSGVSGTFIVGERVVRLF